MDLRHLGAVGEWLAVAGNARLVGLDHRRIAEDRFDHLSILTNGDSLPIFVSTELGERHPARHLQGVLVLRGNGPAAQNRERRRYNHDCRNDFAVDFYRLPLACWVDADLDEPLRREPVSSLGFSRTSSRFRQARLSI